MGKRIKTLKTLEFKPRKLVQLEDIHMAKILQKLWKSVLTSNLHTKDKAEILRFLIFAFTVIIIVAMFVLKGL